MRIFNYISFSIIVLCIILKLQSFCYASEMNTDTLNNKYEDLFITLDDSSSACGDGYKWEDGKLYLNNYNGKPFKIKSDAEIILSGANKIESYFITAIHCDGDLTINGMMEGTLSIFTEEEYAISADRFIKIKDTSIDIVTECEEYATSIGVCYVVDPNFDSSIILDNVSGTIKAKSSESPIAIDEARNIELIDTKSNKRIAEYIANSGQISHFFVKDNVDKLKYYENEDDEYNNVIASDIKLEAIRPVKTKPANTIVAGEKIDLDEFFNYKLDEDEYWRSKQKSKTAIKNRRILKGKKHSTVKVFVKDKYGDISNEHYITILHRPKLRFSRTIHTGDKIDAYNYFRTKDTLATRADKWDSSDISVAEINAKTGEIIVKSIGKTKITAWFGTLPIRANLIVNF